MKGLNIKSISALKDGQKTSTVSFGRGINIIVGPSNSGKTLICEAILFCFGLNQGLFYGPYDGYEIELDTNYGPVIITRACEDNEVTVFCENAAVRSGIYFVNKPKNELNGLLLKLVGINEEVKLITSRTFETAFLTWRKMMQFSCLDEDKVYNKTSIFQTKTNFNNIALLSELEYLTTGKQQTICERPESKQIIAVRGDAYDRIRTKQLNHIDELRKQNQSLFEFMQGVDIEVYVGSVVEELEKAEQICSDAVATYKDLIRDLMNYQEKLTERENLAERYDALATQYLGDIERCNYILEGQKALNEQARNLRCPFCTGVLPKEQENLTLDAIQSKSEKTKMLLAELKDVQNDNNFIIKNLMDNIVFLQEKIDNVKKQIHNVYRPKCEELKNKISSGLEYMRLRQQENIYKDIVNGTDDFLSAPEEVIEFVEYNSFNDVTNGIINKVDKYIKEIFKACKYTNDNVRFDITKFDVIINGEEKAVRNGKGYRSFINSIITLVMRKYLSEDAKYSPGFVIIDSPFLGLEENVTEKVRMSTAFMEYLADNADDGQVIIISNSENLPNIDYVSKGVNVIQFTHSNTGRYGFLDGVGD